MEIAEIVLAVFTASGFTYNAVRSYRANHTPKLKRELPIGLWLRAEKSQPEGTRCVVLLSDDEVLFFLPLCGHLSHINGCRIGIPRGNRYWCGTSQSPIYGHSLCIEASRQMSLTHDMKKYGFPVRCVGGGCASEVTQI